MVKVAIPGGSSPALGTSIVNALLATNGRYVPIILSRQKPGLEQPAMTRSGVETRYVNYSDHLSLTAALQGVNTVISTLHVSTPDDWVNFHLNLVMAAEEVGVERFAPSEWSMGTRAFPKLDISAPKIKVWEAVKASSLQGTRFNCGLFMDYLAIGHPRDENDPLPAFREPPYLFHIRDNWVEVPTKSDGTSPRVSLTAIEDIGKFVASSLDLEQWPEELDMVGETLRFDQILKEVEKVTGNPLQVKKLDKVGLQKRLDNTSPHDFIGIMECQLSLVYCDDNDGEGSLDPGLNKLCPHVKPMRTTEFLEKYWNDSSPRG